jgi:hypothetical protein
MEQQVSELEKTSESSRTGPAVIEYASPVPSPRLRPWAALLALAVYVASLLMPAVHVGLFADSSNSAMPGYAAAHAAFAMTFDIFAGNWWSVLPVLGVVANVSVVASIALLIFSRAWRIATWTACLAALCMLGCLSLYADLRVGYLFWLISAFICLVAAFTRRRHAII